MHVGILDCVSISDYVSVVDYVSISDCIRQCLYTRMSLHAAGEEEGVHTEGAFQVQSLYWDAYVSISDCASQLLFRR